jgi:cytochrome c oxidase subunit 2
VTAVLAVATGAVHGIDDEPLPVASGPVDGRTVFTSRGCGACHTVAGVSSGPIGPDLTDLDSRAGDRVAGLDAYGYIRQSILEPQAFIVPGFGEQMPTLPLTEAEIDGVASFLLSN